MDRFEEENKIYVVLGNDLQDGYKTLEWTLKKWNSQLISITLLHVTSNISIDFVYTPLGKLPASAISDEKLEALKKFEKERIDKLLSKYLSYCGQVKAELLKVEKCDDPIHKVMIDMISGHGITKLVMGFSSLKTSWNIKNAISGTFYVHKNKPDFCELFIICGGKQFSIRGENNKGIMEDEQGVLVAKLRENNNNKGSFKDWLGKIFVPNPAMTSLDRSLKPPRILSLSSALSLDTQNQWQNYAQEIEEYFQHLLASNSDEQVCVNQDQSGIIGSSQQSAVVELACPEVSDSNLTGAEKIEVLKRKLKEAKKIIQANRLESKANAERRQKAKRTILLCNRRAEELQARIKEEVRIRTELKDALDSKKQCLVDIASEVEKSKSKLILSTELKMELSNKLQISKTAISHSEAQLESTMTTQSYVARETEELKNQRDVLRRRIEFCREKDEIRIITKIAEHSCGFKEYSAEQIRLATNGFSERLRLKPGSNWTMYRGRINHSMVAIKMLDSTHGFSQQDFQAKVQLLSQIRHPNLVSTVGFCGDLKCMVFEYMHNGSLRDIFLRDILYSKKTSGKRIRTLRWHDRVRVAAEICSGLGFLHTTNPKPIVHGHLRLSNILLDRNLVAKISGFGLSRSGGEHNVRSDIRAFGVLLMHLLTGRNWAGLVEAMTMTRSALVRDMDEMAGKWPVNLAERLADLSLKCLSSNRGPNLDLKLAMVMEELNELREKAADLVANGEYKAVIDGKSDIRSDKDIDGDDAIDFPSCFICPIFQEVMKNPHVASDGFSYELEAIEEWLRMGNETSPMTNLRLKHTFLTPNHALRTLIHDWHNKRSIPLP